ncbi:MAG: hypothetical protein LBV15_03160, partial [Planctomycetota bacterium]|nr:hypothetical protein [Planctomycetota bacterium]
MLAVLLFLGYYGEVPRPDPPAPGQSILLLAFLAALLLSAAAILNRLGLSALRRRRASGRRRLAAGLDLGLRAALALVAVDEG